MPNIKLKAKLQAYSKAPFYADWVRDIKSIPNYNPKSSYVRYTDGNGTTSWEEIDTTLFNEEKLTSLIRDISSNKDYAQSIKIIKPNTLYDESNPDSMLPGNAFGFYDWNDNLTIVQFPYLYSPDYSTIGVKVDSVTGEGHLCTVNVPDNVTLKINNSTHKMYVDALLTDNGALLGNVIDDKLKDLDRDVQDLIQLVKGTGGMLDPWDFGVSEPTEEELHWYYRSWFTLNYLERYPEASQEDIEEALSANPIPNQTKVKNLHDNSLWVYSNGEWYNSGVEDVIVANNQGVFGIVTGSLDKFKVAIEINDQGQSLGTMAVNGLEEEFSNVVHIQKNIDGSFSQAYVQGPGENQAPHLLSISEGIDSLTLVQRTTDGTIICETPTPSTTNTKAAINIEWHNQWLEENSVTEDDINTLLNDIFSKVEE